MRVLSVASLLFLATSAPVFAAPVIFPNHVHFARNPDTSASGDSGALSLPSSATLGKIATGASVASGIIPVVEGIFHHFFGGGNSTRRDVEALQELFARADEDSEAISLKTIGKGLSFGIPLISGIASLFGGHSGNSTRREVFEILARADTTDQSDAISLSSIFGIGSDIVSGIEGLFGGSSSSNSQRRELLELLARANVTDQSDAISLSSIFGIGSDIINGIEGLFGGSSNSQKRALLELLARDVTTDQSGALNFGSLFSGLLSGVESLFGGSSNSQRRELLELLARDVTTDQSGALNLGSLFSGLLSGVESLFGGSSNSQRRELLELLARDVTTDQSGALNFGSLFSGLLSGVESLFGGSSSSQRRELLELLARDATANQSGALDIESIIGDVISGIESLLGGSSSNSTSASKREGLEFVARASTLNSTSNGSGAISFGDILGDVGSVLSLFLKRSSVEQRREFFQLLARDVPSDADSSEAFSLGSLFKGITSVFGIASDIFGGSSSNSTRRDFVEAIELLGRDTTNTGVDESGAFSLNFGDLKNIASIAGDAFKVVTGLLGGSSGNSTRRDGFEFLVRDDADDASGAFKLNLGDAANIGSIVSDAVGVFHTLFGGSSNSSRRDAFELLTRDNADDASGAFKLSLGDASNIGSIVSDAVGVFHTLFGGSSNSTRREFFELLEREMQ